MCKPEALSQGFLLSTCAQHFWQCLDPFLAAAHEGVLLSLVGRDQGCDKHPSENDPASNISGNKVAKLWYKQRRRGRSPKAFHSWWSLHTVPPKHSLSPKVQAHQDPCFSAFYTPPLFTPTGGPGPMTAHRSVTPN